MEVLGWICVGVGFWLILVGVGQLVDNLTDDPDDVA